MYPTKERNLRIERNRRDESIVKENVSLGTPSPDPWDLSRCCQSQLMNFVAGAQLGTGPSLVLAPESALSLLPSRGLSSAPAACSVPATAVLSNGETKRSLIFAALSDMPLIGPLV